MDPRLKSSVQWTPFPEEFCDQAKKVLSDHFQEEYDLKKSQFVVEGRIYREEVLVRYGLEVEGQLKQYNFEISFEYDSKKQKVLELIHQSMDLVESLWTNFFTELFEDDLDDKLPREWESVRFEKKNYFYRYSTVNTRLEREADRLLSIGEKNWSMKARTQSITIRQKRTVHPKQQG